MRPIIFSRQKNKRNQVNFRTRAEEKRGENEFGAEKSDPASGPHAPVGGLSPLPPPGGKDTFGSPLTNGGYDLPESPVIKNLAQSSVTFLVLAGGHGSLAPDPVQLSSGQRGRKVNNSTPAGFN